MYIPSLLIVVLRKKVKNNLSEIKEDTYNFLTPKKAGLDFGWTSIPRQLELHSVRMNNSVGNIEHSKYLLT